MRRINGVIWESSANILGNGWKADGFVFYKEFRYLWKQFWERISGLAHYTEYFYRHKQPVTQKNLFWWQIFEFIANRRLRLHGVPQNTLFISVCHIIYSCRSIIRHGNIMSALKLIQTAQRKQFIHIDPPAFTAKCRNLRAASCYLKRDVIAFTAAEW